MSALKALEPLKQVTAENFLDFCRQMVGEKYHYTDNRRCAFATFLSTLPGMWDPNVGMDDYDVVVNGFEMRNIDIPYHVQDALRAVVRDHSECGAADHWYPYSALVAELEERLS